MRKLSNKHKKYIVAGQFCAVSPLGIYGMLTGIGFFCWS